MAPPTDFDELLSELEGADERLRQLYRLLADSPDLAEERASELRELHETRRRLAEAVGLAVLSARRSESASPSHDTAAASAEPASSEPLPQPPASKEEIEAWTRSAARTGIGDAGYADSFTLTWESKLEKLMVRVGPPRELDVELADEIDALDAVGKPPLVEDWASMPRDVQRAWLGMLVARMRAVKAVTGLSPSQKARVKTIISRYPAWAAEHQPGHVQGMRLDHAPLHGTWGEDARRLWARLRDDRDQRPGRAPAKRRPAEDADPDDKTIRSIDPAWPLWSLVRGRHLLLLGGTPREPNRKRLETLFELRALEWPEIDGPRKVSALVERIRRRSVDLVVILRGFIDHKQSEPILGAAKETSVPWALSDGYGATSIKTGLERFLAPRTADESEPSLPQPHASQRS